MLFLQYHNTILFIPDVLPDKTIKTLRQYIFNRYTIANVHILDMGRILADSEYITKEYYTFNILKSV